MNKIIKIILVIFVILNFIGCGLSLKQIKPNKINIQKIDNLIATGMHYKPNISFLGTVESNKKNQTKLNAIISDIYKKNKKLDSSVFNNTYKTVDICKQNKSSNNYSEYQIKKSIEDNCYNKHNGNTIKRMKILHSSGISINLVPYPKKIFISTKKGKGYIKELGLNINNTLVTKNLDYAKNSLYSYIAFIPWKDKIIILFEYKTNIDKKSIIKNMKENISIQNEFFKLSTQYKLEVSSGEYSLSEFSYYKFLDILKGISRSIH